LAYLHWLLSNRILIAFRIDAVRVLDSLVIYLLNVILRASYSLGNCSDIVRLGV